VRAPQQILPALDSLPEHKVLSIGIVDGRNIWRNDLENSVEKLSLAYRRLVQDKKDVRLWLAPSCSLLHCPVDLEQEQKLDAEFKSWLAFARQKLDEVSAIRTLLLESGS